MQEISIVTRCSEDDARKIAAELRRQELEPLASKQKFVGGDVAAWVVIVSAVIQAVPPILKLLESRLGPGRVTKIKVGEIEIENPTADDLTMLRAEIARKLADDKDQPPS